MLENSLFWSMIIIYEVIICEQILIISSLKRRFKLWTIISANVIITVLITLLAVFVLSKQEGFGDGGGRNLILGLLFLIPGFLLFKGSIYERIVVNLAAFTFGIGLLIISIRVGYIFSGKFFYLSAFICYSILTITTLPIAYKFFKNKFVAMLSNLSDKSKITLLQSALVAFFLVILLNSAITRDTNSIQKAIVAVLLFYFIIINYKLVIDYNEQTKMNDTLLTLSFTNKVTNMANSVKFYNDIDEMMKNQETFILCYIDLDSFKSINDTFGHIKGDEYLFLFGEKLRGIENELISCYHLSGDEFCVVSRENYDYTLKLVNEIDIDVLNDIKFLGMSFGFSFFPKDGTKIKEVLSKADRNMYKVKKSKGRTRRV